MRTILLAAALAGCISEDPELGELSSSVSVDGWLVDLELGTQQTRYQVGVVGFNNRLRVLYKDVSSSLLRVTSFDGSQWHGPTATNLQADYGPALTVHNNQLVAVYNAYDQDRLLMATSSTGTTWSGPVQVGAPPAGAAIHYAPAVTSHEGQLYIAYCFNAGFGSRLRVDKQQGTSWVFAREYGLASTCKSVAFGSNGSDGKTNLIFNTESSGTWRVYNAWIYPGGAVGSPNMLDMRSKKPVSTVHCAGITHLLHGGNTDPEDIYWSHRGSDGQWVQDERIPGQSSDGGAAIGCLNGRAIMVHNGTSNQLWWSEYVPD